MKPLHKLGDEAAGGANGVFRATIPSMAIIFSCLSFQMG
jgi:hypothetical protein